MTGYPNEWTNFTGEAMDRLLDNTKSIKNRCEVIEILAKLNRLDLIHTILEDMYDVSHILISDYCIDKDD